MNREENTENVFPARQADVWRGKKEDTYIFETFFHSNLKRLWDYSDTRDEY